MVDLIFVFVLGSVFGSFANVVIFRSKTGESLWNRSHCPFCGRIIAFYDLIPVLSYLLLLGQCRSCRREISWQYPLVEFFCGFAFAAIYGSWGISNQFAYYSGLTVWFVIIFISDWRYREVDDRHVATALIWVLVWAALSDKLFTAFAGAVAGLAIAAAITAFSRWQYGATAFGTGDVTLSALIGAVTGWSFVYETYCLALIYHIVAAAIYWWCKRGDFRQVSIPFGPALILASYTYPVWMNFMRGDVF